MKFLFLEATNLILIFVNQKLITDKVIKLRKDMKIKMTILKDIIIV